MSVPLSVMPERLSAALADRYRLERELGQGGMATVYLAQDLKHDRKVAVKVLKPELSAVIGGARFLTEIKTTANLQHPHILPLHDSGEVDGAVFYVMPFIDGESLRDRLAREKQLPVEDALRIATEVADALHYAHGHGVIHRDIKPENILLHGGHALVADFGIALAASATGGARMTETGMSLGTPTYMSPEQAMGEREITARSDVYALGCVLYEMLLGEPPFTGPTAQSIVAKVLSERPAPMRGRRERIPPAVEAAVFRALEKLPADRFGTLAEFSAALAAPMPATMSHGTVATPAGWRGDRRLLFVAGLVGGLALASVLTLVFGARETSPLASMAAVSAQLTFNGRSWRPAISPDGEFVAFIEQRCPLNSLIGCAQSLIVQERANARPVVVLRDALDLTAPRWTSDGLSLVVGARLDSLRSGLFVVPRLGGVPRSLGDGMVFDTHATADSVLVIRRDPRSGEQVAHVLSVGTGARGDSMALGARRVDGIGWSPDGSLLALLTPYESITIVDRDGAVKDSMRGPFRTTVRWTPDGRGILVFVSLAVKEDNLERYEIDPSGRVGARSVLLQRVSAILLGEFDLARRAGRLAFVAGTVTMDLWTFDLPPALPTLRQRTTGTTWYSVPAISPDGERLYYLRGDALGDNIHQLSLPDTEEALRDGRQVGGFIDVRVSRDGRRVIFGQTDGAGLTLYDLDVASRRSRAVAWPPELSQLAPVPFGERGLAYSSFSGDRLMVIDSLGATERSITIPDSMRIIALELAPDEREVAVIVVTATRAILLGTSPLAEWRFRELHRFRAGEVADLAGWSDDGWIHFATTRDVGRPAVLSRIRADRSGARDLFSLPAGCTARVTSVASAAPRGTCVSNDMRGDVWLADLPGMTR